MISPVHDIDSKKLGSIIFFGKLNTPASFKFNDWLNKHYDYKIIDIQYRQSANYENSIFVLYELPNNKPYMERIHYENLEDEIKIMQ